VTATLDLVITVSTSSAPAITSSAAADLASGTAGSVAVTTTGVRRRPDLHRHPLADRDRLQRQRNGHGDHSGSSTQVGAFPIVVTRRDGVTPNAHRPSRDVGTAPTVSNAAPPAATVRHSYSFKVNTDVPAGTGISAARCHRTYVHANKDGTATDCWNPAAGIPGGFAIQLHVTATNYVNTSSLALSIALGARRSRRSRQRVTRPRLTFRAPTPSS